MGRGLKAATSDPDVRSVRVIRSRIRPILPISECKLEAARETRFDAGHRSRSGTPTTTATTCRPIEDSTSSLSLAHLGRERTSNAGWADTTRDALQRRIDLLLFQNRIYIYRSHAIPHPLLTTSSRCHEPFLPCPSSSPLS
jgi:hypothetical protein